MCRLDFDEWNDEKRRIYTARLESLADVKYRDFQAKLVPGISDILGVRIPDLRSVSKEIIGGNWRSFLETPPGGLYEEMMVYGMVTAMAKCTLEEKLERTARLIPLIDNWAVCDIVVGCFKQFAENREAVWSFILPYLSSEEEYQVRFAAVVLLTYFVSGEYIGRVLKEYDRVRHSAYYVKMAVAWGVSVCFAVYPEITLNYLKSCRLDDDTYNKALQKIIESNRVSQEDKAVIRSMKRKTYKKTRAVGE